MQPEEVKISNKSSGPSFALFILSLLTCILAGTGARDGHWDRFATFGLWSVITAIRSNGL